MGNERFLRQRNNEAYLIEHMYRQSTEGEDSVKVHKSAAELSWTNCASAALAW